MIRRKYNVSKLQQTDTSKGSILLYLYIVEENQLAVLHMELLAAWKNPLQRLVGCCQEVLLPAIHVGVNAREGRHQHVMPTKASP